MAEKSGDDEMGKVVRLPRKRRCPVCGKPTVQAYRPFCSQRCADQDLGRWLTGAYRIAAEEEPDLDGDPEAGG